VKGVAVASVTKLMLIIVVIHPWVGRLVCSIARWWWLDEQKVADFFALAICMMMTPTKPHISPEGALSYLRVEVYASLKPYRKCQSTHCNMDG